MKLLAIESSSPRLSLAVGTEDQVLKTYNGPLAWRHAESLFEGMQRLLSQVKWSVQDLTGVIVSTGPGSFTGIRIGIAAARALGQSKKIPVVGISSLETIARKYLKPGVTVCALIDALRGDVFTACYQMDAKKKIRQIWKEDRLPVMDLVKRLKPLSRTPLLLAGEGAVIHKDALRKPVISSYPQANVLLEMGRTRLNLQANSFKKVVPLYLRSAAAVERRTS